jgi:hypothetical protein
MLPVWVKKPRTQQGGTDVAEREVKVRQKISVPIETVFCIMTSFSTVFIFRKKIKKLLLGTEVALIPTKLRTYT